MHRYAVIDEQLHMIQKTSTQGVSNLRIIEGEMDARLYTDTMQRTLKSAALAAFPTGAWKYLYDNAPYHTARESYTGFATMELIASSCRPTHLT
jgi:hypothetical protein